MKNKIRVKSRINNQAFSDVTDGVIIESNVLMSDVISVLCALAGVREGHAQQVCINPVGSNCHCLSFQWVGGYSGPAIFLLETVSIT